MQNNRVNNQFDLKKRSYLYALEIISFIDSLDKRDLSVQVISKQLLRSATSVGANIVEAQAGSSRKDFANFFSHALKSANESKFWLGLLKDSQKTDPFHCEPLMQETGEIANMLGSSIVTLRSRNKT